MAPRAENQIGRWGATSFIVGNVVGAGIFISPKSVVKYTGSIGLSMCVWILCGAISTLGAFCYVELGTSIRRSGGDFAYLCHVKWNAIAFMFMSVGCVLIYPMMLAIQANTFAEYIVQGFGLKEMLPDDSLEQIVFKKLVGFLTVWLLLFLNFFSLRKVVARFQFLMVTSLAKIVANVLIVGIAFYYLIFKGSYENLRDPFANSTFAAGNLVNAFFAGFFSYDGWDVLNFGAEEIKDPKRTMPFAILVGMSCVSTIYATINLSYFIVLTVPQIENSPAVVVDFAQNTIGRLQVVMPFVINLALINAMNGSMFSASRYLFAVARERHLPSFISFASTKHDSPKAALFVHVLLVFIFSFVGNTEQLMEYLGFAQWLQRGFTMCALLYIRFGHLPVHPQSIRVPLLIPILFMFICFSVVIVTLLKAFSSAFVGLIVLGASLFVYFIFVWDKALPRFRCYSTWTSKINDLMARLTQLILDGQIDANEANALVKKVGGKNSAKIWPVEEGPQKEKRKFNKRKY